MLEPIITNAQGSAQLNSLKRYALSACIVPRQDLALINIPISPAAKNPGRSTPIPLQGPGDGKTEVYSLLAGYQFDSTFPAVRNAGIGTVSYSTPNLVGVGTKFLSQLVPGMTIYVLNNSGVLQTLTVVSVASDTLVNVGVALLAITNQPFAYTLNAPVSAANMLYVTITDQAWRRQLMNRDVPVVHVFGTQQKPLYMKESILLETDQSLLLNLYNYSQVSAATFAPMVEGRKWQMEALKYPKVHKFLDDLVVRKKWVQPYWLTLDVGYLDIAAGASQGAFFTCTGDITLVLFNAYAFATDGSNVDQTQNVTVELSDAKTFRAMQTQPVPLSCVAGNSQDPYRLPTPWIVEPQTQIKANFVNNTAGSVHVGMTFHGVAIYTGSNFNGSTLTNKHLIQEAQKMYHAMSIPQVRPASPQI